MRVPRFLTFPCCHQRFLYGRPQPSTLTSAVGHQIKPRSVACAEGVYCGKRLLMWDEDAFPRCAGDVTVPLDKVMDVSEAYCVDECHDVLLFAHGDVWYMEDTKVWPPLWGRKVWRGGAATVHVVWCEVGEHRISLTLLGCQRRGCHSPRQSERNPCAGIG